MQTFLSGKGGPGKMVRPYVAVASVFWAIACVGGMFLPYGGIGWDAGLPAMAQSPDPVGAGPTGYESFPIFTVSQQANSTSAAYMRSLGIDTLLINPGSPGDDAAFLQMLRQRGMQGVIAYNGGVASDPALLAWMLYNEPDAAGITPAGLQSLYNNLKANSPSGLAVLKVQGGFYQDSEFNYLPPALGGNRAVYGQYFNSTDVVSFSIYPVAQWNRPDWIYIPGAAVRSLRNDYGLTTKPIWPLIEASHQNLGAPAVRGPSAEEFRFQAWDSVISGASGLGYFLIAYNPFRWFNVDTSLEAEMRRVSGELALLKKALLAPAAPEGLLSVSAAGGKAVHYASRSTGSRFYLMVVNADMGRTGASITVSSELPIGSVREVLEDRWLSASGSSFADTLQALEPKVYEINLLPPYSHGASFYLSRSGNNTDGQSWQTAWNEMDQIDWSAIEAGDTLFIDGGVESMAYLTPLNVYGGGSGEHHRVTLRRSEEPGRNGRVEMHGQIRIRAPYVTLEGVNRERFVIYPTDVMSGFMIGYWTENARGSEVRNVTLWGNYSSPNGVSMTVYSTDCLVEYIDFYRSAGEDQLGVRTTRNITIQNNLFRNLIGANSAQTHRDAISTYPGTEPGYVLTLRNNRFEYNFTDNYTVFPALGTPLGGFEIWGNHFFYVNTCIHFDSRVASADFVNINNNTFERMNIAIQNSSPIPIDSTYNAFIYRTAPGEYNVPPLVYAGPDARVDEGSMVTLDGSRSMDPNGDPLVFRWTQIEGPPVLLQSPNEVICEFRAPMVTGDTFLRFELAGSDAEFTSRDEVVIRVRDLGLHAPVGLVAAYAFEDSQNGWVADLSGNDNHGRLSGSAITSLGRFGSGAFFDGVDDLFTVGHASTLNLTTGLTLQAWIRPASAMSGWKSVILKEGSGLASYGLYANIGPLNRPGGRVRSFQEMAITGGATLEPDIWTFLAMTYDGSQQVLYVNGTEVARQYAAGAVLPTDGPLQVGGNLIWGEYFVGIVDQVRIYNRALSGPEILWDMYEPLPGSSDLPGEASAREWHLYE